MNKIFIKMFCMKMLDGVPVANWRSEEIVNHMGKKMKIS